MAVPNWHETKDGEVSAAEFARAIQANCVGKKYSELPGAFKAFMEAFFRAVDVNGSSGFTRRDSILTNSQSNPCT